MAAQEFESPFPEGRPVPVRLIISERHRAGARYALRALLTPLGLEATFDAASEGPGIAYGPRESSVPPGWVRIVATPDWDRPDESGARTAVMDRSSWPVLFPGGVVASPPIEAANLGSGSETGGASGGASGGGSDSAPGGGSKEGSKTGLGSDMESAPSDVGLAGDPVATAWYLLSGASERAVRRRDRFGRIRAQDTLPSRLGIADRPIVDALRMQLFRALVAAGVPAECRRWNGRAWAFCPTHDIDYMRKWRPGILYREVVQRGLLNALHEDVGSRVRRLRAAAEGVATPGDPFRASFDRIPREVEARDGTATFFLKAGAHGPHDVTYRLPLLRRRILRMRSRGHEFGLHPSFHAADHRRYLDDEAKALARVTGRRPDLVRTHYLRLGATSPALFADAGFTIDSTIGFADAIGFRRGTCLPYPLWDDIAGAGLPVWEMPLALMESAIFNRAGLTLERAVDRTADLARTVERYGGVLVGLWHNILWDESEAPGWGEHFTRTLDRAQAEGALIAGLSAALRAWHA